MNRGIHYASVWWTFVFVSHCILPDRLHSRGQCPNARSLSVNSSFFIQCFFSIFSIDAILKCIMLAVILSRFGHHPGYYTTIDFWSGLEYPSDLDLVTAHAITPQIYVWSGLADPSDAKSSEMIQMSLSQYYMFGVQHIVSGRSFCLQATTHVMPAEPSVHTMSIYTHFV